MNTRSLSTRVSSAVTKLSCAFLVALVVRPPVSLAQAEEPSVAALRFYDEYMSMGVVLKILGDRWFTPRFRGVINALDHGNNPALQKPAEAILPWKDWDSSWRSKLRAEVLQASPARAQVVVTFATDEKGRPIARLVHLERDGDAWRVDNVTDPPQR